MPTPSAPSGLFEFFDRPPIYKSAAKRIRERFGRQAGRFSFAVISSALGHIALGAVLVIAAAVRYGPSPGSRSADDFRAFRQALRKLSASPENRFAAARLLSTITEDEFDKALGERWRFDSRLTTQEKTKILQAVMSEALGKLTNRTGGESALDVRLSELLGGLQNGPASESRAGYKLFRLDNQAGGDNQVYGLPPDKEKLLTSAIEHKDNPGLWSVRYGRVFLANQKAAGFVPEEYFFRKPSYETILAVGSKAFAIVNGFPPIGQAEGGATPDSSPGVAPPIASDEPKDSIQGLLAAGSLTIFFSRSPSSVSTDRFGTGEPPPPELTEANRSRILDRLMALPERDQVAAFFRDYLDKYDPDSPELAVLTRDFIYKNLGTVLILTDPLSAGFDSLEDVFYDKFSLEDFASFCLKNERTRTSAEILLCLASSYDFEKRAVRHLQEAKDTAEAVLAGWHDDLAVYDKQAKAFVVGEVGQELRRELRSLGLSKLDSVWARYTEEQMGIYRYLITLGGDVKNRALYAMGCLYWDEGRSDLAQRTWKSIDPSFSCGALNKIRLTMSGIENAADLVAGISRALGRAADADSSDQFDRLRTFHKWARRSADGL